MGHDITGRFLGLGAVKRWGRSCGTHLILSHCLTGSWKGLCSLIAWRERTQRSWEGLWDLEISHERGWYPYWSADLYLHVEAVLMSL